jgi:hypothetical protein
MIDYSIADAALYEQQRRVARLQELIDRANYARWQQLETGILAYGRVADRAMDMLKEEAQDARD